MKYSVILPLCSTTDTHSHYWRIHHVKVQSYHRPERTQFQVVNRKSIFAVGDDSNLPFNGWTRNQGRNPSGCIQQNGWTERNHPRVVIMSFSDRGPPRTVHQGSSGEYRGVVSSLGYSYSPHPSGSLKNADSNRG